MGDRDDTGAAAGDPGLIEIARQADQAAGGSQPDAAAPGGAPGAAAPPTDYTAEAAQLVKFTGAMLKPIAAKYFPSLIPIYTADVARDIGNAAGPLMAKYDWTLAKFLARWMAEINFALVTLPLVVPTIEAIGADRKTNKANKAAEGAGQGSSAPAGPAAPPAPPADGSVNLATAAPPASTLHARA